MFQMLHVIQRSSRLTPLMESTSLVQLWNLAVGWNCCVRCWTQPHQWIIASITDVIRSCSYHIWALWHIRPHLAMDAAKMIAQGLITASLDYSNGLLLGTTARNLDRLQVAQSQNALARAVCQTDLRRCLHWLPTDTTENWLRLHTKSDRLTHQFTWHHWSAAISHLKYYDHLTSYCCLNLPLLSHFLKRLLLLAHLPSGTDFRFTVWLLRLLPVLNANSQRFNLPQHWAERWMDQHASNIEKITLKNRGRKIYKYLA